LIPPRYPAARKGRELARALTDVAIRNLKPRAARYEVPDPGARGLYVVVQPSGARSFAVRFRVSGQPRKLTLQGGISLAAARKLAASAMHDVAEGRDPTVQKREAVAKAVAAKANTLRAICEEYLEREGTKLRTAHRRAQTLKRLVYNSLGSRNVHSIGRGELVRLLDQIEAKCGAAMADAVLKILSRVFNWFAVRDDNFRSPIVRGMGRINTKERARSRILSDVELRAVWRTASKSSTPFNALVRFLLLTACRRGEAAEMKWSELENGSWCLPSERNKTKLELCRPLSKAAQAVLDQLPCFADCPFVFTTDGKRPIAAFSKFKKVFDQQCGVSGWTLHDLRRTARSLMSRAGVNADIAERCLGHVIPGVRGVYDRHAYHDEMLLAFERLAALLDGIAHPKKNVVTMRRPVKS
jgi:integrase